jgi:SAM-dependent methyltransferase
MSPSNRHEHWEKAYSSKAEREVSWFQETPGPSLDLLRVAGAERESEIIDIGGGASRLVDALVDAGFARVTVLDLSEAALATTKSRLGARADRVRWIVADVTAWQPRQQYDVWHDRAAFHFLTEAADQDAYLERLRSALRPGGHAIIGTFALDGPEKCSGLPVVRRDGAGLSRLLGDEFLLIDERRHDHVTPWGATQRFQFSTFRRSM